MRRNFALSYDQKMDARNALALLEGKDLTLTDCVRLALNLSDSPNIDIVDRPLPGAIAEFLESRRSKGRSEFTLRFYDDNLTNFSAKLKGLSTAGLTPEMCEEWITSAKNQGGQSARWRALRAFLRWGRKGKSKCVASNLVDKIEFEELKPKHEPLYIPVDRVRRILENIEKELIPSAALGFFAGLRPYEICRLDWSAIDSKSKILRIGAKVSKTGKSRVLEELPETIWRFMPTKPKSGLVCPIRAPSLTAQFKKAGGYGENLKWPADGIRHTFVTYHVAMYSNTGLTSLLAGWEGQVSLLHNNYRGLATQEQAKKFWAIHPRDG